MERMRSMPEDPMGGAAAGRATPHATATDRKTVARTDHRGRTRPESREARGRAPGRGRRPLEAATTCSADGAAAGDGAHRRRKAAATRVGVPMATAERARWWRASCLLAVALAATCAPEAAPDTAGGQVDGSPASRKEIIQPEGVARLPVFSSAVRSGDLIFLSGAIGALPGVSPPTLAAGGIVPETRQTMDNLATVLEAAGAGWEDVVKCTVFLADMADYATFNEVYLEYFPENPPARSALAAAGLAFDARVEVECIAAAPESDP